MFNPIAEINLQNLQHNCKYIKSLIGESKLFPVVKANAYGHGISKITQFLNSSKYVDGLCVATTREAETLILNNITKTIFVLGKFDFENLDLLNHENIIPTIHSIDDINKLKSLNNTNKKLNIQIKVDTGMGRMGISLESIDKVLLELKSIKFNIVGLWSHLSSADELNEDYTLSQINEFKNVLNKFKENQIDPRYIHIANSPAILKFKNSHFNIVRPGIAIYGISNSGKINPNLKPVMKFKLPLIKIKAPSSNKNIGYNRQYLTKKDETIGIFQGGYADGVGTVFNNNGDLLFKNISIPIRGKISMDMVAADISNLDIKLGDYVTVWGEDELIIENLSKKYNKSPYEFLVNLSDRVKRVYVK